VHVSRRTGQAWQKNRQACRLQDMGEKRTLMCSRTRICHAGRRPPTPMLLLPSSVCLTFIYDQGIQGSGPASELPAGQRDRQAPAQQRCQHRTGCRSRRQQQLGECYERRMPTVTGDSRTVCVACACRLCHFSDPAEMHDTGQHFACFCLKFQPGIIFLQLVAESCMRPA
jgi:hypothetical protein